jgi:ribosomal protein S6--L-glutamate ligase
MHVAILSRSAGLYSTRRLIEACRRRGHEVDVLDTLRFSVLMESGHPFLFYDDHSVDDYHAVVPRIGASVGFHGTLVVRQFERMGIYTPSSARGIQLSRDKLSGIQLLASHDIGIPATAFACGKRGVLRAIEQVGGAPVVIKLLEGSQGIGVILAESAKTAETIVETLRSKKQNVLIQRFVRESRGRDIRALVVGGRVVAAMRRIAQGDEFRSNVHRGGRVEPVELDASYVQTAILAARILELEVAGVDLLESAEGPLVTEVNSSPGLHGVETATGVDVAGAVIAHLEERVATRELAREGLPSGDRRTASGTRRRAALRSRPGVSRSVRAGSR